MRLLCSGLCPFVPFWPVPEPDCRREKRTGQASWRCASMPRTVAVPLPAFYLSSRPLKRAALATKEDSANFVAAFCYEASALSFKGEFKWLDENDLVTSCVILERRDSERSRIELASENFFWELWTKTTQNVTYCGSPSVAQTRRFKEDSSQYASCAQGDWIFYWHWNNKSSFSGVSSAGNTTERTVISKNLVHERKDFLSAIGWAPLSVTKRLIISGVISSGDPGRRLFRSISNFCYLRNIVDCQHYSMRNWHSWSRAFTLHSLQQLYWVLPFVSDGFEIYSGNLHVLKCYLMP